MNWDQFFWTALVASVCSLSCAWLGCFLVLKRMSLLGDAISHGVLPGIVLSVLISGRITSMYLFAGAMIFGMLTAVLAQSLKTFGRVSEDAGLGVVFSTFFALGVLLISRYLSHTDLDTDCVFMGNLDHIWFKVGEILPTHLLVLVVATAFIALFWKEMKLAIFDPDLATAMGFSAVVLHYLLIAMVAGVTVVSFEAVGSILVLAMLIVPGATAHMLTDRLPLLLFWAGLSAVLSAVVGCGIAMWMNVASSAGMMAVVAGAQFFLAVLFAPRHGILAKVWRHWHLTLRIAGEDVLAALFRGEESATRPTTLTQPEHHFSPLTQRLALWRLGQKNLIIVGTQGEWNLTEDGRNRAREVVRAHRLWEAFLDKNFELPLDHLHGPAALMEHFLGPELQNQLAQELHKPGTDPHGKAIP